MGNGLETTPASPRKAPAFPSAAENLFKDADTDVSGDLSMDELKAAELRFRGTDKVKERTANELQADFLAISRLNKTDGKDGISRSDLAALRSEWNDISNETTTLRSFNEAKTAKLLTTIKPDGNITRADLEEASTNSALKLTPEQKNQLGYLISNYDEIAAQSKNKESVGANDVVNFAIARSVELPDTVGMEAGLKDKVVTKVKTVEKKVVVIQKRDVLRRDGRAWGGGAEGGQGVGQGVEARAAGGGPVEQD